MLWLVTHSQACNSNARMVIIPAKFFQNQCIAFFGGPEASLKFLDRKMMHRWLGPWLGFKAFDHAIQVCVGARVSREILDSWYVLISRKMVFWGSLFLIVFRVSQDMAGSDTENVAPDLFGAVPSGLR